MISLDFSTDLKIDEQDIIVKFEQRRVKNFMAVNEFKLLQNTSQIQDLFNLLIANNLAPNYMLVSNGERGIKFVRGIHAKDNTINLTADNALSVNTEVLRAALEIPNTSSFELKNNKVQNISATSTEIQYPSAKAVYDALLNVGIKEYGNSFADISNVINAFKNRMYSSGTLYVANIINEEYPQPCLFIQYGAIQAANAKITLMLLYKDIWRVIKGTVISSSVDIESDVSYSLSNFTTNETSNLLATSQYVDDEVAAAKTYADNKLEEAKTYLDELIFGAINGEY